VVRVPGGTGSRGSPSPPPRMLDSCLAIPFRGRRFCSRSPLRPRGSPHAAKPSLAGAIVALSLLFVAWAFGLGKRLPGHSGRVAGRRSSSGSPTPSGNIVTATVLVLALRLGARRAEIGRMALLLGGLAFNALADSAFAYLTANGTYGALGKRAGRGMGLIGYLMIALAPLWPAGRIDEQHAEGPIELWQLALPWVRGAGRSHHRGQAGGDRPETSTDLPPCWRRASASLWWRARCSRIANSLSLLLKSQSAEAQLAGRNSLLNEIISHAPLGIAARRT